MSGLRTISDGVVEVACGVKCAIGDLNADIYYLLEGYLGRKEFQNFLQANKHVHYAFIGYRYISLNTLNSSIFCDNNSVRERILSLILDSRKQLALAFCSYLHLADVSNLGNVHALNLKDCAEVTDVSALGNVHTLNCSYCCGISDVFALGGVHTLNLTSCYKITDVSTLGHVHTLILTHCFRITNVRALGGVHTLNLSGCYKITDVSSLGRVHTLNLSFCSGVTDVSALGVVYIL